MEVTLKIRQLTKGVSKDFIIEIETNPSGLEERFNTEEKRSQGGSGTDDSPEKVLDVSTNFLSSSNNNSNNSISTNSNSAGANLVSTTTNTDHYLSQVPT